MSKYYKAEDVIRAIEEMQNCYNGWSDTYDKAQIIGVLEDLPTIEVSEDCISREYVKCINCAENGSYKCSKCDGEMYYKYDKDEPQTYITEDRDTQILDAWQVHHRNTTTVEHAPSVVPSVVPSGTIVECYARNCEKNKNGKCEKTDIILEFGCE